MFEKDRQFVIDRVLEVMNDWGVTPSERGSGVGDFEYWADEIIAHNGWEPYWSDSRMPNAFVAAGYHKLDGSIEPHHSNQNDLVNHFNNRLDSLDSKINEVLRILQPYKK